MAALCRVVLLRAEAADADVTQPPGELSTKPTEGHRRVKTLINISPG